MQEHRPRCHGAFPPQGKEVLQEQRTKCRSAPMRAKGAQQDQTIQLSGTQISTKVHRASPHGA